MQRVISFLKASVNEHNQPGDLAAVIH